MSYTRVLPRDLFNEAKLLKCLGRLSLLILDGLAPPGLTLTHDDSAVAGFDVRQDPADGGLFCANLVLKFGDAAIPVRTGLNSRETYPLVFDPDGDAEFVFADDGTLSPEFLSYLAGLRPLPPEAPRHAVDQGNDT